MTDRLKSKTAIVTGAASGIGLAIARAFLGEGAKVALLDRNADALAGAVGELNASQASVHLCDVTRADQVDKAIAEATIRLGPPNVLVNNAGISISGGLEEMKELEWDITFAVNVKSIFLVSRRVIPLMRAHGGGSIVNVASESAFIGFSMHPAYCASKAAVVHLSRSMAAGYAKDAIRTNALCPGHDRHPALPKLSGAAGRPGLIAAWSKRCIRSVLERPKILPWRRSSSPRTKAATCTGAPIMIDGGSMAI